MAYRFDLDRDFEAVPFVDQFGTAVIDFALGYELESSSVVLMSVMLVRGDSYLHGQISGIYDLQFGIRVRDLVSDKVTPPDFSTASATKYIPAEARAVVLEVLLNAIGVLVTSTRPDFITMETFYGNLPAKALTKYTAISALLERLAFEVREQFRDASTGIDYWLFAKTKS
jgi:hypothetical protein